MGIYLNNVTEAGNMTRDPEIRQVGSTTVCAFTIANNRKYKTQAGEEKEDALFIDCEAWGKTGDLVSQYCKKGKPVIVEGGLRQQNWQDKDGNKRSKIIIRVERIHFLESGRSNREGDISTDSVQDPIGGEPIRPARGGVKDDWEIPF